MEIESAVLVAEELTETEDEELLVESLIEDISIDGMCGVY